jgi:hypothetical protein
MTPHLDPTKKSTQRLSKSTWLPPLFIPHPGAHNHARAINSIINYQIMLLNPRLSLIKAKNIGSDTAHRLHFSRVCLPFWKVIFLKLFFKYFWIYLLLKNINQQKILFDHFLIKKKFNLVFIKIFFFYFERKTFSGSCEKFRNIILFADYIKFGPQTFNCYIYIYIYIFFVLNICFSISSIRI